MPNVLILSFLALQVHSLNFLTFELYKIETLYFVSKHLMSRLKNNEYQYWSILWEFTRLYSWWSESQKLLLKPFVKIHVHDTVKTKSQFFTGVVFTLTAFSGFFLTDQTWYLWALFHVALINFIKTMHWVKGLKYVQIKGNNFFKCMADISKIVKIGSYDDIFLLDWYLLNLHKVFF